MGLRKARPAPGGPDELRLRAAGAAGVERRMGLLEERLKAAVAELTSEGEWRVSGYFVQPE
jgi:hypothetical protein